MATQINIFAIAMIAVGFTLPSAYASPTSALWTCSNDTESRSLSIGEKEGGGCELHYEKNGTMKVIAWSGSGYEHCIHARDKIRDDLKKAGWKCTKTEM